MNCSAVVIIDEDQTWRIVWHCGDSAYGVDDGDLAKARKSHVCSNDSPRPLTNETGV